jgi:hypothetical protein
MCVPVYQTTRRYIQEGSNYNTAVSQIWPWSFPSASFVSHCSPIILQFQATGGSGGKVSILGCHSIGHSKQECVNVLVSSSERFPR